jgi:hypothetical protein
LGAAFNVDFSQLHEEAVRDIARNPEQTEVALAFSQVGQVKPVYFGLIAYVGVMSGLIAINRIFSRHVIWAIFPATGWGIGLLPRALRVFDILPWLGPEWERQQVENRLGRKI